tara:strand:- start:275 stop:565 length:291 start_codon:yes stop_codon:yes gene_type:complete
LEIPEPTGKRFFYACLPGLPLYRVGDTPSPQRFFPVKNPAMNHGKISNATDDSRHRPGSSEFFKGWIRTWKRAVRKIPDITTKQMLERLDDVLATG